MHWAEVRRKHIGKQLVERVHVLLVDGDLHHAKQRPALLRIATTMGNGAAPSNVPQSPLPKWGDTESIL